MQGSRSFGAWLADHAALLFQGHELAVPVWLPHASSVGFEPTTHEPFGQVRDWVLSTRGGHRLHMHEFDNGQRIVRLDARAPLMPASWHAIAGVVGAAFVALVVGLIAVEATVPVRIRGR